MTRMPFILVTLLLGLAVFAVACGPVAQPEGQAAAPTPQLATSVEVVAVQTGPIAQVLTYAGDLQARDNVSIVPGATGRIESVLVAAGDEVKAGAPLAIIKHDTYETQVQQAEAALTTANLNLAKMKEGSRPEQITAAQTAVDLAKANVNDVATVSDDERTQAASALASTQANLSKAQAEYDKIAWAGDVGQTSQAVTLEQATIAYQTALANYNLATHPSDSQLAPLMAQLAQAELNLALTRQPYREVDFQMAQANIKQADAALKLAQLQLDEATIKAPFDGTVAELYISEGTTVNPQTPIALFISNNLEVEVNVEENRIAQLAKNQNASLRVAAYPDQDFPAVVTSIAAIADPDTHTFAVKVTPVDQARLLRSGMYANVSILVSEKQNAVLVPRAAVTMVNNQSTVYVVTDNKVEQRPVTTGLTNNDNIEVLSGLQPGETVVTSGQSNLTDGASVEVVKGPGT
jgi:HlyD family secretion protein